MFLASSVVVPYKSFPPICTCDLVKVARTDGFEKIALLPLEVMVVVFPIARLRLSSPVSMISSLGAKIPES